MQFFPLLLTITRHDWPQELDLLDGSSCVYKMMGPVLLRVDLEDAKQNVEKRLDLIKTGM